MLKILLVSPFLQRECFRTSTAHIKDLLVHKIPAWQPNKKLRFLYPINFEPHWALLHVSRANILCARSRQLRAFSFHNPKSPFTFSTFYISHLSFPFLLLTNFFFPVFFFFFFFFFFVCFFFFFFLLLL